MSSDNRAARRERRERLGLEQERRRGLRSGGIQLLYLLVAFGLGLLVPQVPIGFTTPSPGITEALVATGASVVTFIGVVYSLLFLVVQFGTTTFTPRLNLFRDAPIVWHAFGFFAGIFVFSFTAAFSTGADEDEISGLVPITLVLLHRRLERLLEQMVRRAPAERRAVLETRLLTLRAATL